MTQTKEERKAKQKEYYQKKRKEKLENYKIFQDNLDEIFTGIRKTKFFELEKIPEVPIRYFYEGDGEPNSFAFVKETLSGIGMEINFVCENFTNGLSNIAGEYLLAKNFDLNDTLPKELDDKLQNFIKYNALFFYLHELIHVKQIYERGWEMDKYIENEKEANERSRYYIRKLFSHKIKDIDDCEKLSKMILDEATKRFNKRMVEKQKNG